MKSILLTLLFAIVMSTSWAQNNGLHFDGNNESLTIDHKPAFNIVTAFTIEAWIYADEWKPEFWRGSIVNKDGPGPDSGYALRCGDGGRLSFVMAVDNIWVEVFTDGIMNEKQWHHVAATVDDGNISLYLDGQPMLSKSYSGTPSVNDRDLYIGESAGFGDRFFSGSIDEVRIWNIARSQSEISDNTTTDFIGNEPGLVAYLPMNEGAGTVVNNLVDAACNASFNNMDESNWVEGYTIPEFDVSPSRISGLDIINLNVRPIRINVDLFNGGQQGVNMIPLEVYVNGELALEETYVGDLMPGALDTYTFFTPLDLTEVEDPEIEIRTLLATDGNLLNNSTSVALNSPNGNIIRLMDQKQHSFGGQGRVHNASVVLPADLSNYEQLLLHIQLDCPTGGCDPWDQPAKVEAVTSAGTFEIARYITPYGIACGPWTVDVTDFRSVLGGIVDFRSFIQVWGNSGWLVTLDLELVEGANPQPYSKITELWATDYLVYGDPAISYDLAPATLEVDGNTESSQIRMTITGHGQGNTNNAAEFSNQTHDFLFNGANINSHNLWKPDCESNSCANQAGNWLFDRAGWCPGQEVQPYIVNTTAQATAGASIMLDYELQSYTNLLNTGYNGSSHTEPHYRLFSYFVESSSDRYQDYFNVICDSLSAEVSGAGAAQQLDKLSIHLTNDGSQPMSNLKVSYFVNNNFIAEEDIPGTLAIGETYIHEFQSLNGFSPNNYNKFYGIVSQDQDENSGDNITRYEVNANLSGTDELDQKGGIVIYPNPSNGELINIEFPQQIDNGNVRVFDQSGKLILYKDILSTNSLQFSLRSHGLYLVQLEDKNGNKVVKKLVVHP